MKDIELYDIISLKNGKDYTVIRMIEENEKMYLLLAGVDENEEPDIHDIRIVEEITKNGKKMYNLRRVRKSKIKTNTGASVYLA